MTEPSRSPLGASVDAEGTTFSIWSHHAQGVELCLLDADGVERRVSAARGDDDIWSVRVPGVAAGQRYGYRVYGPYDPSQGHRFNPAKLLLDPYARLLSGPISLQEEHFGYRDGGGPADRPADRRDSAPFMPASLVAAPLPPVPDAERPWIPIADSIIYEAHVKGLTRLHPELPEDLRGTYAGLAHPAIVEHLIGLGVTALELLPIQQHVTRRFLVEHGLTDYWGYNTIAFLAPDPRYAATGDPRAELRGAIRALHAAGLEVIADVVLNHTGEGDHDGPTLAFRGIDNVAYYRLNPRDRSRYANDAGTGNTLDATQPVVQRLVLDSLRTFAGEYGVDGFRFDLATILGRTRSGFSPDAPIFAAIAADPLLGGLKMIAEPWDAHPRGYRLGHFPAGWSEWNGRFRDDVRRLWAGLGPSSAGPRLGGSPDLYAAAERRPSASINFVTAHDGFTLLDLVSYDAKHNEANAEGNHDGESANYSHSFGIQGATRDPTIVDLRDRQRRALLATLMVARGVPMLLAGDELGRTQLGNNNAYSQDNAVSWVGWELDDPERGMLAFLRGLVALRRAHSLLRVDRFAGPAVTDRHLLILHLEAGDGDPGPDARLLVILNPTDHRQSLTLPVGGRWSLLLDSADATPPTAEGVRSRHDAGSAFEVRARSVVLFAQPREAAAEG